jgi:hypothetical protein
LLIRQGSVKLMGMARRKTVPFRPDVESEQWAAATHALVADLRSEEAHRVAERNAAWKALYEKGYTQAQIAELCNRATDVPEHRISEGAVEKALSRMPRHFRDGAAGR